MAARTIHVSNPEVRDYSGCREGVAVDGKRQRNCGRRAIRNAAMMISTTAGRVCEHSARALRVPVLIGVENPLVPLHPSAAVVRTIGRDLSGFPSHPPAQRFSISRHLQNGTIPARTCPLLSTACKTIQNVSRLLRAFDMEISSWRRLNPERMIENHQCVWYAPEVQTLVQEEKRERPLSPRPKDSESLMHPRRGRLWRPRWKKCLTKRHGPFERNPNEPALIQR